MLPPHKPFFEGCIHKEPSPPSTKPHSPHLFSSQPKAFPPSRQSKANPILSLQPRARALALALAQAQTITGSTPKDIPFLFSEASKATPSSSKQAKHLQSKKLKQTSKAPSTNPTLKATTRHKQATATTSTPSITHYPPSPRPHQEGSTREKRKQKEARSRRRRESSTTKAEEQGDAEASKVEQEESTSTAGTTILFPTPHPNRQQEQTNQRKQDHLICYPSSTIFSTIPKTLIRPGVIPSRMRSFAGTEKTAGDEGVGYEKQGEMIAPFDSWVE